MQQCNSETSKLIGERVRALRKATGRTLNGLVLEKGGLTPATWSRIERGLVDMKFTTLIKVAAVLNVTVLELLEGVEFDYSIYE